MTYDTRAVYPPVSAPTAEQIEYANSLPFDLDFAAIRDAKIGDTVWYVLSKDCPSAKTRSPDTRRLFSAVGKTAEAAFQVTDKRRIEGGFNPDSLSPGEIAIAHTVVDIGEEVGSTFLILRPDWRNTVPRPVR